MDEEASQSKGGKATNLETLTKEELVGKCKNLITFLKKAKTAKDDAVVENDRLKSEHAKVIRQFEEERNKIEREIETMQEVVTSSTESKMILVTKNESLQRQLNLQLSEVEGMKQLVDSFAKEKEGYLKETNKLRLLTTTQQKVVEQLKEDREKLLQKNQMEIAWQEEKTSLIDKIEALESQVEQSEVLKTKCKNLLVERDEALKKLNEICGQQRNFNFESEKKAMEIVQNELKSQNIILEEKCKNYLKEKDELSVKILELEQVVVKLQPTEEHLSKCRMELDSVNELLSDVSKKFENSCLIIKKLEDDLELEKEVQSKQCDEIEKLKKLCAAYEVKIDELKENLNDSETACREDSDLTAKLNKLDSENRDYSSEIEDLRKENESLKYFHSSVNSICLSVRTNDTNECTLDIENSLTKLKDILSLYGELSESSLKLANLVCNFFSFQILKRETVSLDAIIQDVNASYSNFEKICNEFMESNLQEICNSCSLSIKNYCSFVDELNNLLMNNGTSPENCDLLLESKNLPMQFKTLFHNFQNICDILSNLFNFNLAPEVGEIVKVTDGKNKLLENFIVKSLGNLSQITNLEKLLKSSSEEINSYKSFIEERDKNINSLELNLKSLKDEINEMQKLKIEQEETISSINKNYELLKAQQKDLEDRLRRESEDIVRYKEENSQLNKECHAFQSEVESLKLELTEIAKATTSESEEQRKRIELLEKEKECLIEENKSRENEKSYETTKIESLIQETLKLKSVLESLESDKQTIEEELKSSNYEVNKLLKDKRDLDEENSKIKTDCSQLNELNISYKERVSTLEEENNSLNVEIAELRKRIQEYTEKEASLNSNIENLNCELEKLREEQSSSICNGQNYQEQISTLEEQNKVLSEEIIELRKQIKEYEEKETFVNSNIENLNSELERSREENASLCNEFNDIKNQLEELKVSSEDLSKLKDDYHVLEQHKNSLNDELTQAVQRNEEINGEFEVLKREHESILNKLEVCERELQETRQQNSNLSETCNDLKKSLKILENIKQKHDDINEENEKSKLKLKSLSEQVEYHQNIKKTLEERLNITTLEHNSLNNMNEKLQKEIENLKSKMASYELQITDFDRSKTEFEQVSKDWDILKKKTCDLEAELSQVKNLNTDLEDQLTQVNDHLIFLRDEKEALQSNVKTLEAKVIGCVQSIKSWPDKDVIKSEKVDDIASNSLEVENSNKAASRDASTKYTEVISELNEMLQIIRKRGEKISLLEDEIRQKDIEIEDLKVKLEEAGRKLCSGEKELASKDEELQKMQLTSKNEEHSAIVDLKERITVLEEENLQLRKTVEQEGLTKATAVSADAQSEVMSTSTISKMEESCRMKELEDTFEERYMKLKNLAIKLKKKLMEQTAEIKALEESKRNLFAEKEEMVKKGQSHIMSKNIQALQSEIDKLNDNLDAKVRELKEREKQLFVSAQEISDLKSKLAQLEEDNGGLISSIKNTEESWMGQKTLNDSLQGQVTALEKRLVVEEEKIVKGQEEREELEAKLEEKKKVIEQLTKELEELRQDNKKHSLIDLEMKDYERSIEELTILVKEKDEALTAMKNTLSTEETKVNNLSEEISLLKEQVENETERAEKHKKGFSDYKEKLSQIRLEQEAQMREKEKDRETIEGLNQELEKQKLCLAELSAQSSKTERQLWKEKELAENKVEILEESLQKNEKLIENLKAELKELQKQFEAYKVRAHNVLKQKNKIPQQNYEDLKSEKEQLQTDLEASQLKAHKLQAELTATRAELGFLNSEKDKLNQNLSNLSTEFAKKESILEEKMESLQKKFESKSAEYQVIIGDMSAQTEAMDKSFKAQLESEKDRHESEVRKLEERLEESEGKLWQLKNSSSPGAKHSGTLKLEVVENPSASLAAHHTRKVSHSGGAFVEEHRIDVANMIRGEGEGSEWVEPHPNRSPSQHLYNPPTLEQLINNPFPSQSQLQRLSLDDSTSVISATTDFSVKEIARLENRLSASDNRIQQLTVLLNESEAENARLVQLSDTLKEEIRRTSRNERREKHLENNEYLKNVVLKFITLKTGDEKFRLVPVLKTLLQLSPEEANNIAFVAKGEDTQNIPQGWGNYLHLWSGR